MSETTEPQTPETRPSEEVAPDPAQPAVEEPGPHAEAGDGEGPGPSKVQPESISPEHLKTVLESLVFVADEPVTPGRLARAARTRLAEVRPVLAELVEEYAGRGIELVEVAGGYQFRSAASNAPFVRSFIAAKPIRLTRAQLEVLSISAYRQPVTRPEMDEIRGVDCGSAIKVLLERGLIKILGRKEEPGRPLLYGTTPAFLEFFGLASLGDLPTLKEFSELSDESRALFERKMGEALADGELERLTRESSVPPGAPDAEDEHADDGEVEDETAAAGPEPEHDDDDADDDDAAADDDDADDDDDDEEDEEDEA